MWNEALKNYQPQENEDSSGFAVLKGKFLTKINHVQKKDTKTAPVKTKYELELEIVECLEGEKSYGKGRKLWKRYDVEVTEKVKELVDDLFTAGISLPTDSQESFEGTFPMLVDKAVSLRAWGFPSQTKRDGSTYGPGETPDMVQTFKIFNPASVKVKGTSEVPF